MEEILGYKRDAARAGLNFDEIIRNAPDVTPEKSLDPKKAMGSVKPPLALIPPVAEVAMANVMALGADKYGAWNWRCPAGLETMTYIHAAKRHLNEYLNGVDIDEESGESHLAHVMACCAILLDAQDNQCLDDNRPTTIFK